MKNVILSIGLVFLFCYSLGSQSDLESVHEFQSSHETFDGCFGISVSGIPDLDGDKLSDIIVGTEENDPCRAYIFSGNDGYLLYRLESPNPDMYGHFGSSVSGVNDMDGDGFGDVVVGACREDPGASPDDAGRVYTFSGATGVLLHTLHSPNEESSGYFGYAVSGIHDLNGDGLGDIVVGAYWEDPGSSPSNAGRAYVFSGTTDTLLLALQSPNEESNGNFGYSVSGIPDVNGDGLDDIIVGAQNEDPGSSPSDAGRAYIFSGADGVLLHTLQSPDETGSGHFGCSVAGINDITGDGRGDVIVGAYLENHDLSPGGAGSAYVFNGNTGSLVFTLGSPNKQEYGYFGLAVSGVPDFNGDGVADIVVGACGEYPKYSPWGIGRAYLFSGSDGAFLHTLKSPNEQGCGFFGNAVCGLSDTNGDMSGDLIVGAYMESPGTTIDYAGRVYLFQAPPRVLSITRLDANPSNLSAVDYLVKFTNTVSGVEPSDFSITTTAGMTGTSVSQVQSQSCYECRVTVSTGSGNGSLRLDLIDDDSIKDFDNSRLGGLGAGNGDFINGKVYTIDKTAPTIPAGITLYNASPTNLDVVAFGVDFDEPVGGSFKGSDITLLGTLASGAVVSVDGPTSDSFTALVKPADPISDGTIGISITGNVTDGAGNPLTVPVNSPLYTIRNYLGDKNDDGDVNASELNEVILYYRDLLP